MAVHARKCMKMLRNLDFDDSESKNEVSRKMLGAVGDNVHIDVDFHCEYDKHIFIGSRTIINQNCTFI